MQLIHTKKDLASFLAQERAQGKTVGLVPTMGALHQGHASLVKRSVTENDITVVSVFLNPTQFNDPTDLEKYPRTLEADCRLLEACGAQAVFAPSVKEMYPEPDRAYFGEKDFQQIAVIRRMVADLGFKLEIVPCPVIREESGLAMSSRNTLLAADEKAIAPKIFQTMKASVALMGEKTVKEVHDFVVNEINSVEGLEVQYYSIVDGRSLAEVSDWTESEDIVGCITVYCGKQPIRLIDHIRYK